MKEAYLYESQENLKVRCFLCNHGCVIKDGARGLCHVRENRGGKLYSLVYGKVVAQHVDPIEKKPLFHFLPGTRSYSIATAGCNFHCVFCQNADISQMTSHQKQIWGEDTTAEAIVHNAIRSRSATIAYTYTEPTVYFELALDTARLATRKGLRNIFVSNGYMTEACLREIHPDLHGANIDLKAFTDRYYKELCGAKLAPVLKTLESMVKLGIWLEVTTLLVPGKNDSKEELADLAGFLARLDPRIPWHISRFHPTYQLTNIQATPPERIRRARDIGYEAGLKYVYSGNLPGDSGEKTFCHQCGKMLIDRHGFSVRAAEIKAGRCRHCSAPIPGVWQ